MTFHQWLLAECGLSVNTANQYDRRITAVRLAVGDPLDVSAQDLRSYVEATTSSAANHNHVVAALNKYREYTQHLNSYNGFAELLYSKPTPKRLPKPLSHDEIEAICKSIDSNTPDGLRDRAVLELLYCGLRNEEVCNLRLSNIENKSVRVVGKGNKERIVPVNDVAWGYLVEYCVIHHVHDPIEHFTLVDQVGAEFALAKLKALTDDWIFKAQTGVQMYTRLVRRIIYRAAKKAGVKAHPHQFRHSFATHVLDEGLTNLMALQDTMGHTNLETTKKYVLVTSKGRNLLNSFHPRQRSLQG